MELDSSSDTERAKVGRRHRLSTGELSPLAQSVSETPSSMTMTSAATSIRSSSNMPFQTATRSGVRKMNVCTRLRTTHETVLAPGFQNQTLIPEVVKCSNRHVVGSLIKDRLRDDQ